MNGSLSKPYMKARLLKIKEGIHERRWYPQWSDTERWAAQQALNNALEVLDEYER